MQKKPNLYFAFVALFIAFVPFILIAFYCFPSADDFVYAWSTKSIGILESCKRDYWNWNGRYFSNLLVFMNPMSINSLTLYRIIPTLLILGSLGSTYLLIETFCLNRINRTLKWSISGMLCLLYLNSMPRISEGIYWYTGSVTYQLAIILLTLYTANLMRYAIEKYAFTKKIDFILILVQVFCIAGFSETGLLQLIVLQAFFLLTYRKKVHLFLLTFTILSGMVMIFSPGNTVRSQYFPEQHHLWFSFYMTTAQIVRFGSSWIFNLPMLACSLWFVSSINQGSLKTLNEINFLIKKPSIFLIGLLAILFISVFPPYWAMGMLGQHRTVNAACYPFIFAWFLALIFFSNKYENALPFVKLSRFVMRNKKAFIALLVLSFVSIGNLQLICKDLISGKAEAYKIEMENRTLKIEACLQKKDFICELDSLKNKPASIFNLDLRKDTSFWINKGTAAYFDLQAIRIKEN